MQVLTLLCAQSRGGAYSAEAHADMFNNMQMLHSETGTLSSSTNAAALAKLKPGWKMREYFERLERLCAKHKITQQQYSTYVQNFMKERNGPKAGWKTRLEAGWQGNYVSSYILFC